MREGLSFTDSTSLYKEVMETEEAVGNFSEAFKVKYKCFGIFCFNTGNSLHTHHISRACCAPGASYTNLHLSSSKCGRVGRGQQQSRDMIFVLFWMFLAGMGTAKGTRDVANAIGALELEKITGPGDAANVPLSSFWADQVSC